MRFDFCKICHGITKRKCFFCGLTITDYRKISSSQVDHNLYLRNMWLELKKFNMLTTGLFSQDEELANMWGHWRNLSLAESYARDIMRGVKIPKILYQSQLGKEIDKIVHELSAQRLSGSFEERPSVPVDDNL